MRITWIILAILLVLGAVGTYIFTTFHGGIPVDVAKVQRGPIREYVDEEAKTRLAETYRITMPFEGRIEAIHRVEGTNVKQGEELARIVPLDLDLRVQAATAAVDRLKASIRENDDVTVESTSLKQSESFVKSMDRTVEAATARVQSGEAKLGYAEKNLARINRLSQTGAKTEDDLDQAKVNQVESTVNYRQDVLVQRAMEAMQAATALMPTSIKQYIARKALSRDVLEKQLSEAQINLKQALRDRERGVMKSPVDGVILERAHSSEGQLPAGTLLMRIGRWEDLEIEAEVLSQEVVRVKPGNDVEVSGPAIGPVPAKATVSRVYPAGFAKISSLGVEQQRVIVVMKFMEIDLKRLRQEQSLGVDYRVRVRMITATKQDALVVPRAALFRGINGVWQVFLVSGGRAQIKDVSLGYTNDEFAEVTKGLSAGDQVVLAPETNLTSGTAIQPQIRGGQK